MHRKITRRKVIKAVSAAAAASAFPNIYFSRGAFAADQITIRDGGGTTGEVYKKAWYEPFTKETGIVVNQVASQHEPIAQLKSMGETKTYVWDMLIVPRGTILAGAAYLDELGPNVLNDPHVKEIPADLKSPLMVATSVYATHLAYRTDKYQTGPESWADFFDVKKFPGRRSLRRTPVDTLEIALLADGVPMEKLYPLDFDRAFKKLDQIKKDVPVWWSGGAQASQMLKTGEIDMIATWNSRTAAAVNDGAPAKLVWNQGIYTFEGPAIIKGGPKTDLCRELVKFCARADRQALIEQITVGPSNPNAYKYIKPERAALLPTSPDIFKKLIQTDEDFWLKERDKATQRFNTWLIA